MTKIYFPNPDGPELIFESVSSAVRHCEKETNIWLPYLEEAIGTISKLQTRRREGNPINASTALSWNKNIISRIESQEKELKIIDFRKESHQHPQYFIPPYSSSRYGRHIISLFEAGYTDDAINTLVAFLVIQGFKIPANDAAMKDLQSQGEQILLWVRSNAVGGGDAEKAIIRDQIDRAVGAAQRIEARETAVDLNIAEFEDREATVFGKLDNRKQKAISSTAKGLRTLRSTWRSSLKNEEKKHASLRDAVANAEEKRLAEANADVLSWDESFKALEKTYIKDLQYRSSVRMWRDRAKAHKFRYRTAFGIFLTSAISLAGFYGVAVIVFGDFISMSFQRTLCESTNASSIDINSCKTIFSPKGPLIVGAVLLISSLFLWMMRLQSKIYLSERHMYLGADERAVFALTYLRMRKDAMVSEENEALVLAALFRPTNDGIVTDDDSNFDISAAAVLAKQMAAKP